MLLARCSKSAKKNTSDWKADWKNRVFWHCLIKLCCFSHQDCQQKEKHIASIQFSLQADTKWHSFTSSLCYMLFRLADQASWQGTTVHRAALPQGSGVVPLSSPRLPRSRGSPSASTDTGLYSKQESFLLAKGKSTRQQKHPQQCCVSRDPSAKRAEPSLDLHSSHLFQPELSTSKGSKFTLSSWQRFWNILLITLWFLRAKKWNKVQGLTPTLSSGRLWGGETRGEQLTGIQRSDQELQMCRCLIDSLFRFWNQRNYLLEILAIEAEDSNFSRASKELETFYPFCCNRTERCFSWI